MQHYALPLAQVERVLRMVSIVPVPETPSWLIGIIDLHGRLIPVLDLRERLGHPVREIQLDDRLLVISLPEHCFALVVEEASDILNGSDNLEETLPDPLQESPYLKAVLRSEDGLILVLDAENLYAALRVEGLSDFWCRPDACAEEDSLPQAGECTESTE